MDIKLEKKTGWRAVFSKKSLPYLFGALVVVLIVWLLLKENASTLRVNMATVTVSNVEEGEFNDYVSLSGTVQPMTTMQLSPLESGVVERVVAEEGTAVKAGDVILEMSNKQLSMQILQSEADLAEKQNILRNTLISMEQERLSLRQEMLMLDLEVTRKQRAYEQNKELYNEELVAREVYLQSKEDYELALNRRSLVRERQKQDSLYRTVQVAQLDENLRERDEDNAVVYKDVCNPITKEFREELYGQILEAYDRAKDHVKGTKSDEVVEMPEFSVSVTPFEREGSNIRGLARIW